MTDRDFQLPPNLTPEAVTEVITVPVKTPSFQIETAQIAKTCQDMGLTHVGSHIVHDMRQAGVNLEALGLLKVSHAGIFVTQQILVQTIVELSTALRKTKSLEKKRSLAQPIGYLSDKLIRCQKAMREGEPQSGQGVQASHQKKSFAAGAVIQTQHNYYSDKNASKPPEAASHPAGET